MGARGLWALLAALRAGWCLLPQAGYLHPDEFFQSPEVMAGKAAGGAGPAERPRGRGDTGAPRTAVRSGGRLPGCGSRVGTRAPNGTEGPLRPPRFAAKRFCRRAGAGLRLLPLSLPSPAGSAHPNRPLLGVFFLKVRKD